MTDQSKLEQDYNKVSENICYHLVGSEPFNHLFGSYEFLHFLTFFIPKALPS